MGGMTDDQASGAESILKDQSRSGCSPPERRRLPRSADDHVDGARVRRDRTEPDGGRGNASFNEPLLSAGQ